MVGIGLTLLLGACAPSGSMAEPPQAAGSESLSTPARLSSSPAPGVQAFSIGPAATDTDRTVTDRTVEQFTADLLRLHAERMQLLSREQRTRDRFAARHPEVAVAEVAALPGDVHDLAGLRDIGERLAANRPELPESDA